jgi:large subunit ribosomal protein L20
MRVKRGLAKQRRHRKILKLAKGYRMSYSKLFKRAHEAVMHAGKYSLVHRRHRAAQYRELWIERINAALQEHGMKYGRFMHALKTKNIGLNRKMLAALALDNKEAFAQVVAQVK